MQGKLFRYVTHVDGIAARRSEHEIGKRLFDRISSPRLSGPEIFFRNELLLKRTTRDFLKNCNDLKLGECFRPAKFDNGVASSRIRQCIDGKLRDIMQRNVADPVLS